MRLCSVLTILAASCVLAAQGVQARTYEEPPMEVQGRECIVQRKLAHGEILISRWFSDSGEVEGEDYVKWDPLRALAGEPSRPLDASFYFTLPVSGPPMIDPRRIELRLVVGLDAELPGDALIEMQRPFPVEPDGSLGSSALAVLIFSYSDADRHNGHGELPLGDLLAYAEGYDDLAWTLNRRSEPLSGGKGLATGRINIAALREAVRVLPELRQALVDKAADFESNCPVTKKMLTPIVY